MLMTLVCCTFALYFSKDAYILHMYTDSKVKKAIDSKANTWFPIFFLDLLLVNFNKWTFQIDTSERFENSPNISKCWKANLSKVTTNSALSPSRFMPKKENYLVSRKHLPMTFVFGIILLTSRTWTFDHSGTTMPIDQALLYL